MAVAWWCHEEMRKAILTLQEFPGIERWLSFSRLLAKKCWRWNERGSISFAKGILLRLRIHTWVCVFILLPLVGNLASKHQVHPLGFPHIIREKKRQRHNWAAAMNDSFTLTDLYGSTPITDLYSLTHSFCFPLLHFASWHMRVTHSFYSSRATEGDTGRRRKKMGGIRKKKNHQN